MVTIATEAACALIMERTPVKPEYFFVEANMSGDKKASAQSFLTVRGKKVTAEAVIPAETGGTGPAYDTRNGWPTTGACRPWAACSPAPSGCRGITPTVWRPSTSPAARMRPASPSRPWG